jgi:hypothetical protein
MDTAQLDTIAPKLVNNIKVAMVANGNAAIGTTEVLKKLYADGITGKEQDFLSMAKVVDTMFAIAHAPVGQTAGLWEALSTYALNGLRTSI